MHLPMSSCCCCKWKNCKKVTKETANSPLLKCSNVRCNNVIHSECSIALQDFFGHQVDELLVVCGKRCLNYANAKTRLPEKSILESGSGVSSSSRAMHDGTPLAGQGQAIQQINLSEMKHGNITLDDVKKVAGGGSSRSSSHLSDQDEEIGLLEEENDSVNGNSAAGAAGTGAAAALLPKQAKVIVPRKRTRKSGVDIDFSALVEFKAMELKARSKEFESQLEIRKQELALKEREITELGTSFLMSGEEGNGQSVIDQKKIKTNHVENHRQQSSAVLCNNEREAEIRLQSVEHQYKVQYMRDRMALKKEGCPMEELDQVFPLPPPPPPPSMRR